jgi:hypothetical protein
MLLTHSAFSQSGGCGNISSGHISFNPGSCNVLPEAKNKLGQLAGQMQADPECRVIIVSNAGGNKPGQQLSWERVTATIEEMSENHNIARDRFIFVHDGVAPVDQVTFRSANPGEEGPSSVAPPYPAGTPCR